MTKIIREETDINVKTIPLLNILSRLQNDDGFNSFIFNINKTINK